MKTKLGWPDSAFSSDGTASDGAVSVGLSSDGRDVCLVPFLPTNKSSQLSVKLADLIQLEDHLQFDRALLTVKNRKLSMFSLAFWVDKLMVLLMFVTGNKDQIDKNIFDTSLQGYKNPGQKEDFPYDKPLQIVGLMPVIVPLAGNPYLVVLDQSTNEIWIG